MSNNYVYKGAVHIHTNCSDGTGNIKTVVKAAKSAGLDWIIITDHNYYDTDEGIFDGIYVIKGEEVSPHDNNHYLIFGINNTIEPSDNPQNYINMTREQGGFGFAAHPDEGTVTDDSGNIHPRKNSYHCIPWTDKNIKPDGVEIWNWFSNWADNYDDSNLYTIAYSYIQKHKIVTNPSKITMDWWDKLNQESEKIVPAIGGVDAHALKIYKYIIPVTVFPYTTCLKTINNVICLSEELSKNFEDAKQQILNAIKNGNNIIVNRHICNELPNIYVTNAQNTYYCGTELELSNECYLHFDADKVFDVCLVYNGNELKKYSSDKFNYHITKSGKYRLEVSYKRKGFLYTNPFYIKDKANINE